MKATGQQWRYTYDLYDRMIQAATYASAGATSPDRIIIYAYDALDRRIQRSDATASASSPTAVETYIHDGWNTNAIEERTINFGSTVARRTWYTQAGTDDLVALTTWDPASGGPAAAGSAYYSADHLGSVRALHDDTGTVVASYDHDTFGNPQTAVESTPQPFRFTGRDYDRVTGLYHYRTREYDPQAGRFLQEDQIWFNSGDMNVYRYVNSNPLKYRDPYGTVAAIEYACFADFGVGAGGTVGTHGAVWIAAPFLIAADVIGGTNSMALLAQIEAQNIAIGEQIAEGGGPCRHAKPPETCSSGDSNSFAPETLVFTATGLRRIEDVQAGDKVAAWHETTPGGSVWRSVIGKSSRQVDSILKLTLQDANGRSETVRVTPNHPLLVSTIDNEPIANADESNAHRAMMRATTGPWIQEPGEPNMERKDQPRPNLVRLEPTGLWAAAGQLKIGDSVKSANHVLLTIARAEIDARSIRVYNLEIEEDHSFAVGDLEAWVHNGRGKGPKKPNPNKPPKPPKPPGEGRERNVKHPCGEEHSIRPKGGPRGGGVR